MMHFLYNWVEDILGEGERLKQNGLKASLPGSLKLTLCGKKVKPQFCCLLYSKLTSYKQKLPVDTLSLLHYTVYLSIINSPAVFVSVSSYFISR